VRVRLVAALLAVPLFVAACTGVPHSSDPSVVEQQGIDVQSSGEVPPPEKGADPRTVVQEFLNANGAADPVNGGAQFLTPQGKSHWAPTSSTIVANLHIGAFSGGPSSGRVEITGTKVGTVDHAGVYTPGLTGDGSDGGQPVAQTFAMQTVRGEWRINNLQNGLLLTQAQFNTYRQHPIYFFDIAEQQLVPDPRWGPEDPPAKLAATLIDLLASGPRDQLQADETTELPAQTNPANVVVTMVSKGADKGLTKIEIPQASQLGATSRNQLAAQIARTLVPQVSGIDQMEITDNQVPVSIPLAHGPIFTAEVVTAPYVGFPSVVALYYLRNGGVIAAASGRPLPGRIGNGAFGLDSAALRSGPVGKGMLVAATRKDRSAFDIGTTVSGGQLTAVALPPGPLSRPDWTPGTRNVEAWVGDGSKLFRVGLDGVARQINVTEPNGIATPRISAVRLSPEGSRVAMVLTNADQSAQIWIGAVVRTSGQVRVDNLTPISPQQVDILDVAWNDELKLFAVGHNANTQASSFYEVQVDGSLWTSDGIQNLPPGPDAITASEGIVAAVSSGGTIWQQLGSQWASPRGTGQEVTGTNPIYSK